MLLALLHLVPLLGDAYFDVRDCAA